MNKAFRYLIYGLVIIFFSLLFFVLKFDIITFPDGNVQLAVSQVKANKTYTQTFIVRYDNFDSIGLRFGTYDYEYGDEKLKIRILDEAEKEVFSETVMLADFYNNSYYSIFFKKQTNTKNKKYKLEISPLDFNKDTMLAIYGSVDTDGEFLIDGEKQPVNIGVAYNSKKIDKKMFVYVLFIVLFIALYEIFIKQGEK